MTSTNFSDLSQEAQDAFRDLDFHGAKMLAIGAGNARSEARQSEFPTDPHDAATGALEAMRRTVRLELDDPLDFALDVMDVATSALGNPSCDHLEAQSLGALLHLATTALRSHRENDREAHERLWIAAQAHK